MIRFIFTLFVLAGLAIAAFGGYRLWLADVDAGTAVSSSPVPAPVIEVPRIAGDGGPVAPAPNAPAEGVLVAPQSMRGRSRSLSVPASPPPGPTFQEQLANVPVAYETPKSAGYGKTFQVSFAVDGTGDTSAADGFTGRGTEIVEARADVSERLQASLIGPAFEIELTTPEIQRLSTKTENTWRWDVTPIEEGEHALFVELYALDGQEALPVRTFQDKIIVTVSDFQRVLNLANQLNPLAIVISGLGTAVGGMLGLLRFIRRRTKLS